MGGELTIDHYKPLSLGGGDEDTNLIYACFRCNLYKGPQWSSDAEAAAGIKVLHPLRDDLSQHYAMDHSTCQLYPITNTGSFHIAALMLNRPELVQHRIRKEQIASFEQNIDLLKSELRDQLQLQQVRTQIVQYLIDQTKLTRRKKGRRR